MQDFRQEIFTKVKTHLLLQNKKCFDKEENNCLQNDKGQSCSAGCLIPKLDYNKKLEKSNFYNFFRNSGYNEDETDLLVQLVVIHDLELVMNWEEKLRNLAKSENLKYD